MLLSTAGGSSNDAFNRFALLSIFVLRFFIFFQSHLEETKKRPSLVFVSPFRFLLAPTFLYRISFTFISPHFVSLLIKYLDLSCRLRFLWLILDIIKSYFWYKLSLCTAQVISPMLLCRKNIDPFCLWERFQGKWHIVVN